MLSIRRAEPDDASACRAIVRGLPDYFTEDVADAAASDLAAHGGLMAVDADVPVGFLIAERRSPFAGEILWAAVDATRRGEGVGTALVDRCVTELAAEGIRLLEVKTLDRGAGYQPYVATAAFWERRGFVQIDTIDPLPGWQAGNPAAIYVAGLAPTR